MVLSSRIAFHHADLLRVERDAVAQAFRDGVVKVVFATSTLATGVNLPARAVVFDAGVF